MKMIENSMAAPIKDVLKTCGYCGGKGSYLTITGPEGKEIEEWIECPHCEKGYYWGEE
jgi:hypothetical protein